jgi:hypothetical protein
VQAACLNVAELSVALEQARLAAPAASTVEARGLQKRLEDRRV